METQDVNAIARSLPVKSSEIAYKVASDLTAGQSLSINVPWDLPYRLCWVALYASLNAATRSAADLYWSLEFWHEQQQIASYEFAHGNVGALTGLQPKKQFFSPYLATANNIRQSADNTILFWPWGPGSVQQAIVPFRAVMRCNRISVTLTARIDGGGGQSVRSLLSVRSSYLEC